MRPADALVARFEADLEALSAGSAGPFGVAVSGGPDSLALLLLAAAARPGAIRAISIDHGLRPEAAEECRFVARVAERLGVLHDIAAVTVAPCGTGLQAAARDARRRALRDWAETHALPFVLLAHHHDDQAETVLMRLARGSGVGGLAAIGPIGALGEGGPPILRPLLGWSRAELAEIVVAAGLQAVVDPSNADPRYDRTRFRALLAETDLLPPRRLAAAARHARDADEALDWTADRLAAERIAVAPGRVSLDPAGLPRELRRRLLLLALAELGGVTRHGPKVDRLMTLLEAGRTGTLAGIKVTPGPVWTFTRMPPRRTGDTSR